MAFAGNLFGGMLGGLQSQQNLWAQQQQLGYLGVMGSTAAANAGSTYVVSMAPVEAVPVKSKGPETALEWLDRRVNEVRLPLAA